MGVRVKAIDSLRIHFTTVGRIYDVVEEDEECCMISDDRGKKNWIPRRYLETVQGDGEEKS